MEVNENIADLFEKAKEKLQSAKSPKYGHVAWVPTALYKKFKKQFNKQNLILKK